ncbi:hypothetical protein C1645_824861 [Glomus cerebriforme]|uniref:Uncharacterized protein n=1 Tax=Glomus cerebriforme TaxID=658196 RepID=A0A397SZJ2_9GLOM|nr:hypothetical protein C1645_824861 [Glomus cerebriforme]
MSQDLNLVTQPCNSMSSKENLYSELDSKCKKDVDKLKQELFTLELPSQASQHLAQLYDKAFDAEDEVLQSVLNHVTEISETTDSRKNLPEINASTTPKPAKVSVSTASIFSSHGSNSSGDSSKISVNISSVSQHFPSLSLSNNSERDERFNLNSSTFCLLCNGDHKEEMLFIRITTIWSNLKQKISDELFARVTRIINDLDTKNNTLEIKNIFSKLTAEINTKITNELFACLSEVNSTFTVELVKNNNELNKKLTAKIAKINSCDTGYISDVQKIFNNEEIETLDYAFGTVGHEIHQLSGDKIGKGTVKSFYYGQRDSKFNIVMSIMR